MFMQLPCMSGGRLTARIFRCLIQWLACTKLVYFTCSSQHSRWKLYHVRYFFHGGWNIWAPYSRGQPHFCLLHLQFSGFGL